MPHYRLSFTAANLMPLECRAIALQYIKTPDWETVSRETISQNLLGKPRTTSSSRQTRELIARLQNLDSTLIAAIPEVSPRTSARICFLAVLKTYDLITVFMQEVIIVKWAEHKDTLRPAVFVDFYESKSITHPELNDVADSTRKKLRQVLFYMLEQAGYIESSKSGTIVPVERDPILADLVRNESKIYKQCLGV